MQRSVLASALVLSPLFVRLGASAMTASVVLSGVLALRHWSDAAVTP